MWRALLLTGVIAIFSVIGASLMIREYRSYGAVGRKPTWLPPLPLRLNFSDPVDGLSIAIRGPNKVQFRDFYSTLFEVYILNSGGSTVGFSKHPYLVRLAFFDANGQLITNLRDYLGEFELKRASIEDLVILDPGDMLRVLVGPRSIRPRKLRGRYKVRAILLSPPPDWWPLEVRTILKKAKVRIWRGPKLVSPPHSVEIE